MTNEGKTIEKRKEKTWNIACRIDEKKGKKFSEKRAENGKQTFISDITVSKVMRVYETICIPKPKRKRRVVVMSFIFWPSNII